MIRIVARNALFAAALLAGLMVPVQLAAQEEPASVPETRPRRPSWLRPRRQPQRPRHPAIPTTTIGESTTS